MKPPRPSTAAQPVKRSLRQRRCGRRQLAASNGGAVVKRPEDKEFKLASVTLAAIDARFEQIQKTVLHELH